MQDLLCLQGMDTAGLDLTSMTYSQINTLAGHMTAHSISKVQTGTFGFWFLIFLFAF